ncbi:MAG: hypothetical protein ACHBNF_13260 [Chromatiales bacterium]
MDTRGAPERLDGTGGSTGARPILFSILWGSARWSFRWWLKTQGIVPTTTNASLQSAVSTGSAQGSRMRFTSTNSVPPGVEARE